MLAIKLIGIVLIAQTWAASALASNPAASCQQVTTESIDLNGTKPSESTMHGITIHCGAQNFAQSIGSGPSAVNAKSSDASTFTWDKLIESVFKLLGSIAWPIAVGYIAYIFRREFALLLTRLKKGKWGAAEVEFEKHVREADAEADITHDRENQSISSETAAQASINPQVAILTAWIEVEAALYSLVRARHLWERETPAKEDTYRTPTRAIRLIQKAQILDSKWIMLFHDLRSIRNEVAHSPEFSPSTDSVIKYVQLAKELSAAIREQINKA